MEKSDQIEDLNRRMRQIFKSESMLMNVGDIAKNTGLTPSQIRYWEKCGYIKSKSVLKNKTHKYTTGTYLKIKLIKSYLDSGFTLTVAAKKASIMDKFKNLVRKTIGGRMIEMNIIDNYPALNFGKVDEHHQIWFIVKKDRVDAKIIDTKIKK
ncbi:transcriptional regulator [Philodulcilactobacillus myokoensis]|uniref:Transcriptional regulator n=1 Tax=Philodulcilactobacillus myokoensis TaxID=2929573 RepID=A0A9W6AYR2_9LACO|nr:MerR family transcriptional regulator [Philodulcilactobacillus myokoensis]GLB46129.1 transcriptional regulator [Philodulcilactobacillus myokoensis]